MTKPKPSIDINPTTKSDGAMAAEFVASDASEGGEKKTGMLQIEDGVEVVVSDAAEGGEKKMVMLRSEDGEEFVVSAAEASQCGRTVNFKIKYHIIPSDEGGKPNYSPICLSVQGDTLSKVIQYSKMHASRSQDLSDWDAKFIGRFCNETLFDLILAAKYLRNQGLLDLTCQTVADVIKGKSFDDIRAIFNIRSYVTILKNTSGAKKVDTLDRWLTAPSTSAAEEDPVLKLEQNAVEALHIVRCQEFTGYDPKRNGFICTRFCSYNIAFFDLDKESWIVRGPPLDRMFQPISRSGVQSSVNVISLKVIESLVGDDLSVFGTVLARDEVDYRCIYLFRREMDDAQAITLPDGMLTLTDPCRGLVLLDHIYFEINLKIKCDGGEIKDFSRGVISFERARLPDDRQTITLSLNSWLSTVELACAHVVQPVEATIVHCNQYFEGTM
ncbi:unnamed protein product [Alopecurus aequalis]